MSGPLLGLVPAAGRAERVAPLPCSKEVFPLGPQGRPVCLHLLEQLRAGGAERAYVVLRQGKWDVPACLGDGAVAGLQLAYLVVEATPGPAHTLDRAYAFVRGARVLFGFPDIVLSPADVYARLGERLGESGADVVLGLFPAHRPEALDMIDVDASGRVRALAIQPAATALTRAWMCAAWTGRFTDFMHEHLARPGSERTERSVGHVLRAALAAGLAIDSVDFPGGRYLDIGTPEDLARAVRRFAAEEP